MQWNSAECEGGGGLVFQICDFWWELDRLLHRETLFIFPPRGLERSVVQRAKSGSVRACFMVPTNHRAACWKLLRTVSIARLAFNGPKHDFEPALAPLAAQTAFLVDFGETDVSRPGAGRSDTGGGDHRGGSQANLRCSRTYKVSRKGLTMRGNPDCFAYDVSPG